MNTESWSGLVVTDGDPTKWNDDQPSHFSTDTQPTDMTPNMLVLG